MSGTRGRAELEIKDKVCIERKKVESGKCTGDWREAKQQILLNVQTCRDSREFGRSVYEKNRASKSIWCMIDFGLLTRDQPDQYTFLCIRTLLAGVIVIQTSRSRRLDSHWSGWLTWKLLWLLRHTRLTVLTLLNPVYLLLIQDEAIGHHCLWSGQLGQDSL